MQCSVTEDLVLRMDWSSSEQSDESNGTTDESDGTQLNPITGRMEATTYSAWSDGKGGTARNN